MRARSSRGRRKRNLPERLTLPQAHVIRSVNGPVVHILDPQELSPRLLEMQIVLLNAVMLSNATWPRL